MKELLRDAVSIMETWWAKFPQDMSASDRAVLTRMQAEIDAPETYDQQALELCETCGWKTLIPGDCCLNCTRPNPDQEPHGWLIQGSNHLYRGEYAEIDSKSDAQRIGGTCHAYSLYTKPQPVADLQIRLDLMTAERDKLHRENGDMRQSLHFFKPVADLTDDEIKAIEKPANPAMKRVGGLLCLMLLTRNAFDLIQRAQPPKPQQAEQHLSG